MKPFIIGIASLLLAVIFYSYNNDYSLHKRAYDELKYVCEEMSASASLYTDPQAYGDGKIVFNQVEGVNAMTSQIKSLLRLDDNMMPLESSYWRSKITFKPYFFDDSNTTFPYLYTDLDSGYTKLIKEPTVVVTIKAGSGRYRLSILKDTNSNIRSGSHTWEGRLN